MPDYWTHYLHGTRVLRELRFNFENEEEKDLFVLGVLGPNVFYYVPDNPDYLMLGNKLHSQKCGNYLHYVIRELFRTRRAYVYGLICHHTLDRLTHPYIISQVGSGTKHYDFEKAIDAEMVKRVLRTMISELTFSDKLPFEVPQELDELYLSIAYEFFKIDNVSFSEAIEATRVFMQNEERSSGGFFGVFSRLLKKLSGESDYGGYAGMDVLNLNKRSWFHPTTGWESRNTFLDLFEQAVEESMKLISSSLKYSMPPDVPDLSFMTNLPCIDY
ncbi:zinc dependent phospholipase C family protein [Kosmotoga pacifica]|uniref:Phospholipase C/D domain-containing protein n=1 Tax=Kosmotoga pacifica TaxID=1330330 RepID=A0A0G2Z6X1_9BACT|nr:zinc dependent phospholipase C family protein [Kosmotoga pacifica]AKI97307.1 hypothetical protein IX53_05170 [Kosmotoga pacifica]